MKLVVVLLAALALGNSSAKAACHTSCYQCSVRCKQRADDVNTCVNTCLELKRSCCQNCGAGPGPRTTCSCT